MMPIEAKFQSYVAFVARSRLQIPPDHATDMTLRAQAVLDTVHVTNFVQSSHCRWRTDSFSFVRVVSSIFFAFRRLTSGLRLYFLEKFE